MADNPLLYTVLDPETVSNGYERCLVLVVLGVIVVIRFSKY